MNFTNCEIETGKIVFKSSKVELTFKSNIVAVGKL